MIRLISKDGRHLRNANDADEAERLISSGEWLDLLESVDYFQAESRIVDGEVVRTPWTAVWKQQNNQTNEQE